MTVEGHLHYVDPATNLYKEITVPPHTHPESMQFYWNYDSPATMADPGVGKVRTDTASGTPPANLAISVISDGGIDVSNILKELRVNDTIYFQAKAGASSWGRYKIRAAVSVTATWALIPITLTESAGTPISKNTEVLVRFTYGINGGGYGADAASPSKGRNRIVNGDFAVNQRGFTETQIYGIAPWTFDRWYASGVGQGAGATAYLSPVTATVGDLPEAARNYAMLSSYNPSGAAHYVAFGQKMEDAGTLSGKTATFSFWGKQLQAGTSKYAVELVQNFGTGGSPSPSTFTLIGCFTLTNTWTRYSATFEVPSLVGKVRGTDGNSRSTILSYNSTGSDTAPRLGGLGAQHVNTCIWGVQIEEGPVATLFEQRSYGDNLLACQRHFQWLKKPAPSNGPIMLRATTANNAYYGWIAWLVEPRALNAAYFSYTVNGSGVHKPYVAMDNISSLAVDSMDPAGITLALVPTADHPTATLAFPYGASMSYNCEP